MTKRLFGTDGVRGVANSELTPALAFRLGQAAAIYLGNPIVVGKDTRRSGDMLEAALIAGITSAGADAYLAGIIPTPAVAFLTREVEAAGGAVISASHNPPEFNGIKFFDAQGFKLSTQTEDDIEAFLQGQGTAPVPTGSELGQVYPMDEALPMYAEHALTSIDPDLDFSGLTVALDCCHGASSVTTVKTLEEIGCKVYAINDDYEGDSINVDCGSTHPEQLRDLLDEFHADLGLAHDGDADRLIAIDERGRLIDGDFIEAICAIDLHDRGLLAHDTVVSTVMCNLGFAKAMREHGIEVVQTAVGDRNVLECMREGGFTLGGEQSGHTIFLEHNSTGDGLVTALQLLSVMARTGKPLSELADCMTRYPQHLINVTVQDTSAFEGNETIAAAMRDATAKLADQGRVLIRPSGTEPLIRVMVEAADEQTAVTVAEELADIVANALN